MQKRRLLNGLLFCFYLSTVPSTLKDHSEIFKKKIKAGWSLLFLTRCFVTARFAFQHHHVIKV